MDISVPATKSVFARRVALGGLALIIAGLWEVPNAILTTTALNEVNLGDTQQNIAYALAANTFNYRLALGLSGLVSALFVLGYFALYAYLSRTKQERLALVGLILTVGLFVVFLPLAGFGMYVVPAVGALIAQGQPEMVAVMDQFTLEPFLFIPFIAGILQYLGDVPLGIAIWRSGALWKWSGLFLAIYGVVGMVIFFLDGPPLVSAVPGAVAAITVGLALRQAVGSGGS